MPLSLEVVEKFEIVGTVVLIVWKYNEFRGYLGFKFVIGIELVQPRRNGNIF